MSSKPTFDTVVVGGGVIGLSVAHALGMRSAQTAVVSPETAEGSASLAAGAMVDAFGEMSQLTSQEEIERLRIEVEAQRLYRGWLDDLSVQTGQSIFHQSGTFIVSNRDGTYDDIKMRLIREQLEAYGEGFEAVRPENVPGLQPNSQFPVHEALYVENGLCVDTTELLPALEGACDRSGSVTRVHDAVTSVERDGDSWKARTADGNELVAKSIVVCAGAHSWTILGEELRREAGLPKLFFGRGVSCTVVDAPAVPHTIRTPNRILACGFHLVPRARGRLYLGATNWFGTELALPKGPSVGELHSLLDSVMNQLNSSLYAVSIETTNWGLRPVAQFDRPLVGETTIPGLFIATGCHRTGVHMAPLLAQMICEQVLDGVASVENPFCPKAAPKSERPDVSAGVRALLAQALFPSGSLPFNRILELQVFVSTLLDLALDPDKGNEELRQRLIELLMDVGQDEESVMRVFYEVLERELPECGPYPT